MSDTEYYYAIGRRKTAVVTARLYFKKGLSTLNDRKLEEFYPSSIDITKIYEPFKVADIDGEQIMFTLKGVGGGISGKIDAIRLALARAIILKYPEKKKTLKVAGLLTRDPRMVERKKAGLRKARKAEQYSKR